MAGAKNKGGGFVVGPDPLKELAKLRSILLSSKSNRGVLLAQNIQESKQRARDFAERDVAADLET